ncbi:MAG: M24 family metallopeptidase [Magnetococcales bacterium]|nr:M24 family metallopeptidase [Magnetococcales bacterium]
MTARLIYADSERSADLYYAVGLFIPDPFLFVQDLSGRRHMVVSVLEFNRACRLARVDQVHELESLKRRYQQQQGHEPAGNADWMAWFLLELDITTVMAPADFPLLLADQLRRLGVVVTPCDGLFWPQRACKTEEEVSLIEDALHLTAVAMASGIDLIRAAAIGSDGWLYLDGQQLTSERVRGEIDAMLARMGAEASHTIVCGGLLSADPHESGHGPLAAHSPIILDVFPRVGRSGYWGDMTRTVCRGEAPQRLKAMWQAVRVGQQLAFGLIASGCSGRQIHDAVTESMASAGFSTGITAEGVHFGFIHGTGHGLGLEIHEAPRIGMRDARLEQGHVVTVEPGLYYPDIGGVRLEDVVLVTADGCRLLTPCLTQLPKELEL